MGLRTIDATWGSLRVDGESGIWVTKLLTDSEFTYSLFYPRNSYVSVSVAALVLGISVATVYTWLRDKRMESICERGYPRIVPVTEVRRVDALLTRGRRWPT